MRSAALHWKKGWRFSLPIRDVTYQNLPGGEYFNCSRSGRICSVTSRLGTGKLLTFFTVYALSGRLLILWTQDFQPVVQNIQSSAATVLSWAYARQPVLCSILFWVLYTVLSPTHANQPVLFTVLTWAYMLNDQFCVLCLLERMLINQHCVLCLLERMLSNQYCLLCLLKRKLINQYCVLWLLERLLIY